MLVCTLAEHKHSTACLGHPEHFAHTDKCLDCQFNPSTHTHTVTCYDNVGNLYTDNRGTPYGAPTTNLQDGQIYSLRWYTTYYYIYIGGQWYNYNATASDGAIIQPNSQKCHTHSEAAGCYKDTIHQHNEECYASCEDGLTDHKHTDTCYTYEGCEVLAHTHNADCFRGCVLEAHTHNDDCDDDQVFVVIVAKYEQTIGDKWPSGEDYPELYQWEDNWVSKRVTLTSDMIVGHSQNNSVANGTVVYYAPTWQTNRGYNVHYMFESFDQTSGENGDIRRKSGTTFYDKNELYSQYINTTQSLTGKTITG